MLVDPYSFILGFGFDRSQFPRGFTDPYWNTTGSGDLGKYDE